MGEGEPDISAELEAIKEFSNSKEDDPIDVRVKDNTITIYTRIIRPKRDE